MPTLNFKGKSFVENHHLTVKYHQLIPNEVASQTDKVSLHDNLIIHGDNLLALKALMPMYAGQVKLIYIDPPYNTGNESWRYNDNVSSPMLQAWLQENQPVEREDLTRHDKWLCMMMPRLSLLSELLREDGVIFVSIDDNEAHHLRMLMDHTFGEDNFIAQLVWEKGRKNDAKLFSVGHEYMLVYARSLETLRNLKTIWREAKPGAQDVWNKYLALKEQYVDDLKAIEQELQSWYTSLKKADPAKKLSRYKHIDKDGPWRDRDISWPGGGGPRYDVPHPITKLACAVPERGWGFATFEKMQEQIDKGLVEFREDHTQPPFRKAHLRPIPDELEEDADAPLADVEDEIEDSEDVGLQVLPSVFYAQSQKEVKYLRKLMGSKVFENPKDHIMLARIIRYCTSAHTGDIILDSFAGSGSTGHAVLQVNREDSGNRRFILVEMEDYANNLTAERIRRVINDDSEKLEKSHKESFSYFTLGAPIEVEAILSGADGLPSYIDLARHLFYTATGEPFQSQLADEDTFYIGETRKYKAYLIYRPDIEYLRKAALTLDFIKSLPVEQSKTRLIFAPARFVDNDYLEQFNVKFVHLPFEMFRFHG